MLALDTCSTLCVQPMVGSESGLHSKQGCAGNSALKQKLQDFLVQKCAVGAHVRVEMDRYLQGGPRSQHMRNVWFGGLERSASIHASCSDCRRQARVICKRRASICST